MAFIARVGSENFPKAGDTISVYHFDTTDLVANLLSVDGETTISNPITVPTNGWYGFEIESSFLIDIWWNEQSEYLITAFDVYNAGKTSNSFPQYMLSADETDPIFTAWDRSTGIEISTEQITDFGVNQEKLISGTNIKTINGQNILGSGILEVTAIPEEETDPIFTAWDRSTGIEISTEQITDFGTNQEVLISGTNIKTINGQNILGGGDLTIEIPSEEETDPIFTAWDKSTGIEISKTQITDFVEPQEELVSGTNIRTIDNQSLLGSGDLTFSLDIEETDPIFTAWDKSSGITITESQITDLKDYQEELISGTNIKFVNDESVLGSGDLILEPEETDPIFTAWDKSSGITITESQITDFTNYQEQLVSGVNIKTINGQSLLGSGDIDLEPIETDPIFTAWDKSTDITITESQISDLGNYQLELVSGVNISTVNEVDLLGSGDATISAIPARTGEEYVNVINNFLGNEDWQNRQFGTRSKTVGGLLKTYMGTTVDDTWLECDNSIHANIYYPTLASMMVPYESQIDGISFAEQFDSINVSYEGTTYTVSNLNDFEVCVGNGLYVALFRGDSNINDAELDRKLIAFTSTDGINWNQSSVIPYNSIYIFSLQGSIYNTNTNEFVFLINDVFNAYNPSVAITTDGINWQYEDLNLDNRSDDYRCIAYSPELDIMVSLGYATKYWDSSSSKYRPRPNSIYSYDGITWNYGNLYSYNRRFNTVEWSPELGIFCALGYTSNVSTQYDSDGYDRIAISSNGTTWSTYQGFTSSTAADLAWSGTLGKFCAINSGTIFLSDDGISWEEIEVFYSGFDRIIWVESLGRFIIFGDNNVTFHSVDGYEWVEVPYPIEYGFSRNGNAENYIRWDSISQKFVSVGLSGQWGLDAFYTPNIPSVVGETTYIKAK